MPRKSSRELTPRYTMCPFFSWHPFNISYFYCGQSQENCSSIRFFVCHQPNSIIISSYVPFCKYLCFSHTPSIRRCQDEKWIHLFSIEYYCFIPLPFRTSLLPNKFSFCVESQARRILELWNSSTVPADNVQQLVRKFI